MRSICHFGTCSFFTTLSCFNCDSSSLGRPITHWWTASLQGCRAQESWWMYVARKIYAQPFIFMKPFLPLTLSSKREYTVLSFFLFALIVACNYRKMRIFVAWPNASSSGTTGTVKIQAPCDWHRITFNDSPWLRFMRSRMVGIHLTQRESLWMVMVPFTFWFWFIEQCILDSDWYHQPQPKQITPNFRHSHWASRCTLCGLEIAAKSVCIPYLEMLIPFM